MTRTRSGSGAPNKAAGRDKANAKRAAPPAIMDCLGDELWALVLSNCTWRGAWKEVQLLLLHKPGAAHALQHNPHLLARMLSSRGFDDALERAAMANRADVAALLLAQHEYGSVALNAGLQLAARGGYVDVMRLLLDKARLDLYLAMHQAAVTGQTQALALLLDKGAEVLANDDVALQLAADGNHVEAMLLLLQRGGNVEARSTMLLSRVAFLGHVQAVAALLQQGADITADTFGCLGCAAHAGHAAVLQLLLEHGHGVIDRQTKSIALFVAASLGYLEASRVLLSAGAQMPQTQLELVIEQLPKQPASRELAELLFFHGRMRTKAGERRLEKLLAGTSTSVIWLE